MLHIAHQLRRAFNGPRADWKQIFGPDFRQTVPEGLKLGTEKFLLAELLQEWLRHGEVHATVQWLKDELRPVIGFRGAGLFGALAVQLVLSVADLNGWAVCEDCHKQYTPPPRGPH